MNALQDHTLTSLRRTVATVLVVPLGLVVVTIVGFLLPLRHQRAEVERDIAREERELLELWRTPRRLPLDVQVKKADAYHQKLEQHWEQLRRHVDTFKHGSPLAEAVSDSGEGRIDFKVALFDARLRLSERAAARNVSLPLDLGVPETIGADENAEVRRWQLATIFALLGKLIDLGVPTIDSIELMPPVNHTLPNETGVIASEFPVRLILHAPFEKTLALVDALLDDDSFFALRRFRVERVDVDSSVPLTVNVVCGGMVFRPIRTEEPLAPDDGTGVFPDGTVLPPAPEGELP